MIRSEEFPGFCPVTPFFGVAWATSQSVLWCNETRLLPTKITCVTQENGNWTHNTSGLRIEIGSTTAVVTGRMILTFAKWSKWVYYRQNGLVLTATLSNCGYDLTWMIPKPPSLPVILPHSMPHSIVVPARIGSENRFLFFFKWFLFISCPFMIWNDLLSIIMHFPNNSPFLLFPSRCPFMIIIQDTLRDIRFASFLFILYVIHMGVS